tara:strand:+ start:2937 stop:4019 length:1083 start_codon:yes stop_codon:yes gene_type:complete
MEKINNLFTEFVNNLKNNGSEDYQKYFCKPDDRFEFEIEAFKNFIEKHEVFPDEFELIPKKKMAKLKYKYRDTSGEPEERSDNSTWVSMKKDGESWKISNKGEYLKCLAESNKWRKIKTGDITFYFDSFLKKTLDQMNAESGFSELINIKKYLNIYEELDVSYIVYDDEKSLHELGFKSNLAGHDWVISNYPCDVFQLITLCMKRLNPELPKYFLYGFSTYYAHYISKSSFPLFNFPKEDFDKFALNSINYGYYIKIIKLLNNTEFQKWTEMVSIMSILSQQRAHPNLMVFLITASFVKFLFESEALGEIPDIREKRIIEILKTGKENDFEDSFKKITGLKIKKAEKLWKNDLKIKVKNT